MNPAGHIQARKLANGTIAWRAVLEKRFVNDVSRPRVVKVVGHYPPMTREQAEQELTKLGWQENGNVPQSISLQDFFERRFKPKYVDFLDSQSRKNDFLVTTMPRMTRCFGPDFKCRDLRLAALEGLAAHVCKETAYEGVRKKVRGCLKVILENMIANELLPETVIKMADSVRWPRGKESDEQWTPEVCQMQALLPLIVMPFELAAILGCTMSLGGAEVFGLKLRWLNLTPKPIIIDGRNLPAYSLFVAHNCSDGKTFTAVKTKNRRRVLPIPALVLPRLDTHVAALLNHDSHAPVFQNVAGGPMSNDQFGDAIETIREQVDGCDEASPYMCRRYFASACDRLGVPIEECRYLMGHSSSADQTKHYQTKDVERRRGYVDAVAKELLG